MTSPLLPLTLDAIDRLDQIALKRQAEALVTQAVPAATPAQVQAVVQASLDQLPIPIQPVAAPKGVVDFGWKRPGSLAELKRKQQPGWWARQASTWWGKAVGVTLGIVGSVAGLLGGAWLGSLAGQAVGNTGWAVLAFLGVASLSGSLLITTPLFAALWLSEHLSPARFQVAKKAWKHPIAQYLRYTETRELMRAILSSAVPEFLVGDVQVLEQRYLKASAADRATQATEQKKAEQHKVEQARLQAQQEHTAQVEAARQQEERDHQARLAEIAQALK